MKASSTFIIVSLLSASLTAGENKGRPDTYCAELKDGIKVIMHEGTPLNKEVSLNNGTKILKDGTVIKSDGSRTELKEGECITIEGVIDSGTPEKDPKDPKKSKDQKDPDYNKDKKDPKSPKDSTDLKDSKYPPPMKKD